ncbi:apoptosis-inducing factor 3-like isoform X4 [Leptotrombidium deliense]|uniref:Uridine 5'-monophosphate synthase n=1 Tax=Leptotrombidium deliense TaxID=299467 RepID=A0A443SF41_9ACAR|nr:apoptosis-inducing factor 3-like isoform X4 [Leptotrombidium deliense]
MYTLEEVCAKLIEINAVKFGSFMLKSGLESPFYIDLRVIVSFPKLMSAVSELMWNKIEEANFDLICGVPYTALPLATCISTTKNIGMLMRRKEAKSYGTKQTVEGYYKKGQNVAVIEDVLSSGTSILETSLRKAGLNVTDAVVFVDREQGGIQNLASCGIKIITDDERVRVKNWISDRFTTINDVTLHEYNLLTIPYKTLSYSQRVDNCSHPLGRRLLSLIVEKSSNVCVAIDLTNCKDILDMVEKVGPYVIAVKIHVDIIEDFSVESFVKPLSELAKKHNFIIFEDRKFADIGNTVKHQYVGGMYKISNWAHLVTAHAAVGSSVVTALKSSCLNVEDRGCLLIAEMSCEDNALGTGNVEKALELANKHNDFVVGFICQSKIGANNGFLRFIPGVNIETNSDGLGQRYVSPESAIVDKGADVLIVGRGVTTAKDCVSATSDVNDNELKEFAVEDGKVVIAKQNGVFHALGSKCSHYGAPLEKGVLYNGYLRCPWHAACFNISTGDIEDFPAFDSIPCYEVLVKNDDIWIKAKLSELKQNKRRKTLCKRDITDSRCFVIVGAGAAGFQCCETLRQEGFTGRIVLLTAEDVPPYDRTKLSKALSSDAKSLSIRSEEYFTEASIELHLNKTVSRLDQTAKKVVCSDNTEFIYDKIFLATGVSPRRYYLPGSDLKNIFYLRTYKDANGIAQIATDKNVVIVGTSFIVINCAITLYDEGMEVAAYLCGKAKSVSVIGRSNVPFKQILGQELGARIKELYESKGVIFHLKTHVKKFVGSAGSVEEVVIPGSVLPADVVVVGIGTEPNVSYLDNSGVSYAFYNNIVVNEKLETAIADVYAGGDIAAFPLSTHDNKLVAIGHWQIAQIHGKTAALSMLGLPAKCHTVPFFWSMMFGKGLRFAGFTDRLDDVFIAGNLSELNFVAYYFKDDKVVSVATMGNDPVASLFAAVLRDGHEIRKEEILYDSYF